MRRHIYLLKLVDYIYIHNDKIENLGQLLEDLDLYDSDFANYDEAIECIEAAFIGANECNRERCGGKDLYFVCRDDEPRPADYRQIDCYLIDL